MPMKTVWKAILVAAALSVPTAAMAQDPVKVILNWTADVAHLGFAVAQHTGIYERAGLAVEFEEGRGSSVAAQLVATEQADIGLADGAAILNLAAQGAPVKVIAPIWKVGQFGIISLDGSGISSPADLKGKKIGVAPGSALVSLMPVFLKQNGLTESDIEIVSAANNTFIGLLTSGQLDAVAETPQNVLVPLADQGVASNIMYFSDYGVSLLSLSLAARDDRLAANPDLYRRFIQATAEGWLAAIENPEASVEALRAVFPDGPRTAEALLATASYSFASICPAGSGDHIAATSAEDWAQNYELMTSAMGLPADKPVTDYYTLDLQPAEPVLCP